MLYNPALLNLAEWRLEKQGFIPPDQGGGAPPPGDPSAAGGMPPPGMDPSMAAGALPPGDPAAAAAPPGPGIDPEMLRQIIRQEMANGQGGAPGAGGKPVKVDINTIAMDVYQMKKMISGLYHAQGLELPTDIIDGPNRDPSTGAPVAPGTPGSTSDASKPPQAGPDQKPAIPPLQGIQPAIAPPGAPPEAKAATDFSDPLLYMGSVYRDHPPIDLSQVGSRASAVHSILSKIRKK